MYVYNQLSAGESRKYVHRRSSSADQVSARGPARPAARLGEVRGPIFQVRCPDPPGCPPEAAAQCQAVIRDAVLEAIRLATNAANRVQAATALRPEDRGAEARQTAALFQEFFGHDPRWPVPWAANQASGVSVAFRFRAVANELNGGRRITFICRPTRTSCGETDLTCCCPADNAWFSTALPNTVTLCSGFWNPPAGLVGLPTLSYRAAIILHEMLHMLFESIRDAGRGRPRASCYEAFALRLAGLGADPFDVCNCRGTPCPPSPFPPCPA